MSGIDIDTDYRALTARLTSSFNLSACVLPVLVKEHKLPQSHTREHGAKVTLQVCKGIELSAVYCGTCARPWFLHWSFLDSSSRPHKKGACSEYAQLQLQDLGTCSQVYQSLQVNVQGCLSSGSTRCHCLLPALRQLLLDKILTGLPYIASLSQNQTTRTLLGPNQ